MNNFSQVHRFTEVAEIQHLVRTLGWDLCYTQLSPGRLEVEAFETRIGDCLLFQERIGCRLIANGHSTREAFDVMLVKQGTGRMFGNEFLPLQLALFPPGCEVDAVGMPGVVTQHVQVPRERLEKAANRWDIDLIRTPRVCIVNPGIDRLHRFRRVVDQANGILRRGDLAAWEEVEGDLLATLVAVFDVAANSGIEHNRTITPAARYAVAARDRIQTDHLQDLNVARLAGDLGIGRRHLSRCFKQHYGVTVQQFLRIRRLHEVHRMLVTLASELTVTEAASSCGFRHLGRFSIDYKAFFGRSPRETLRQSVAQT